MRWNGNSWVVDRPRRLGSLGAMFTDVEAQRRDMARIFRKHRQRLGTKPAWRTLRWRFYRSVAGEYRRRGRWLAAVAFAGRAFWARIR